MILKRSHAKKRLISPRYKKKGTSTLYRSVISTIRLYSTARNTFIAAVLLLFVSCSSDGRHTESHTSEGEVMVDHSHSHEHHQSLSDTMSEEMNETLSHHQHDHHGTHSHNP